MDIEKKDGLIELSGGEVVRFRRWGAAWWRGRWVWPII